MYLNMLSTCCVIYPNMLSNRLNEFAESSRGTGGVPEYSTEQIFTGWWRIVQSERNDKSETWNETFFRGIVVYKSQLAFSVILCLPIFAQIKKTSLKFQNSSESTEPIWMDRQMAANIDQRTNDQVEMIWHSGYQLRDNFVNIMLVDINLVDKLVYSEKEYLTFTLGYFLSLPNCSHLIAQYFQTIQLL